MSTVTERVAAGAAFLDKRDPGWWVPGTERAIDLGTLSIASASQCVLGQRCPLETLAAFFNTTMSNLNSWDDDWRYTAQAEAISGLRHAGGLLGWAVAHGFSYDHTDRTDALTAEWKRVITARRSA